MPTSSNVIAHVYADLAESTVTPKRVTCVQYDADTKMVAVHMLENGEEWEIPSGYSANVRMKKTDGNDIYNAAEIDGNIAYVTLTEQMCVLVGTQYFCVEIISGEDIVQTATIALEVTANPITELDVTSEPEYTTLDQAVKDAQAAAEEAANAAQDVVDENLKNYYQKTESDERYLQKAGGAMTGDIDMDSNAITGLTDPTQADEAARKGYVDDVAQKIDGIILTDTDDNSTYRAEFSIIDGYPAIQLTKTTD